jgi:AP-3 complex subunit beta
VVFAVARVFFYAGSVPHLSKAVTPLLRIMQTSTEVERVVLAYLLVICETHSVRRCLGLAVSSSRAYPRVDSQDLFAPSYTRFLVRTDDASAVKSMKIQLLLRFMNSENHQALLREFIVSGPSSIGLRSA